MDTTSGNLLFHHGLEWAKEQDEKDILKQFRNEFLIPKHHGEPVIYFTGNSLGLQPVKAEEALRQELKDWEKFGVEGHFQAKYPWYSYHEDLMGPAADLVGAMPGEVVHMNGLTTNLHLLMVSFYRPTPTRYKILCEKKAFPSDQYALESQVRFHGFDPADALVEIGPRKGEHLIKNEDILQTLEEQGAEIAMVMIGGVNYYTGQLFDMKAIAEKAREKGVVVGFDLAHAAGNIEMNLHDWGVDFAAWCSYKYLNSGPGSVGGIFVHEKHGKDKTLPRFAGWWGYDKNSRFEMKSGFVPMEGAEGWQLSNAPVFSMAIHRASLDIFQKAGMQNLTAKSKMLTGYLEFTLKEIFSAVSNVSCEIITPSNPQERGCQLSVLVHGTGKELFDYLTDNGVVTDWREPNVIRMAPVPLYNTFEDIYRFGEILKKGLQQELKK